MNITGVTFTKTAENLMLVETFDGYMFYIEHNDGKHHFKPYTDSYPTTAAHLTLRYKLHKRLNDHEY